MDSTTEAKQANDASGEIQVWKIEKGNLKNQVTGALRMQPGSYW